MNTDISISVSRKCARQLLAGHPWVYRSELQRVRGEPEPGQVVHVTDEQGRHLCWAFFAPTSLIALRVVSRDPSPPTPALWAQRVANAAELRSRVVGADSDSFRAIYSDADGLPGLVADKYGDTLVVQLLTAGIERIWPDVQAALISTLKPKGVLARNDQKMRELEGLDAGVTLLYGEVPETLIATENGLRFQVSPWTGQKTGAYLDQRETRLATRAFGRGRVLDAFTYQGWFAINLAATAEEVVALDSSAPALEHVKRNAELNGLTNVSTAQGNAMTWLRDACDRGERFDTVLLDPPAFCKTRAAIESGMRAYKEINLRGMRLLDPGGVLITSSCSHHLTDDRFEQVLEQAASDAGRTMQILERRGQGRDHPRLIGHPESYYLNTYVLRVL